MSKGHFVFEIGAIRALTLFILLLASGFAAGAVWAIQWRGKNQKPRQI